MCYQLSLFDSMENICHRYTRKKGKAPSISFPSEGRYRISAYNYPEYPLITSEPEIQTAFWGLIPAWIKNPMDAYEIRGKTLNARSETIFIKPSYKTPILSGRCLIPATGFFEWRHEEKKNIPYYIRLKNEKIFSIAGLYDTWEDPETNATIKTFSLITTAANTLMSFIHNTKCRMPLIISGRDEEKWLDPDLQTQEIKDLLKPYPDTDMDAYTINPGFLRMNPDDPAIIEKVS